MRISINSAVPIDYDQVGFGTAIGGIYKSLQATGWQVEVDSPSAPVQFHWMQPHMYRPNFGPVYNILYCPWESTEFRTGWLERFNHPSVDEVWTTSEWCADIFRQAGVKKTIHVYPHGIDHSWKPRLRQPLTDSRGRRRPLKYLIVDAEANRKGWQEAFDAFYSVFGDDRSTATLTIKSRQLNRIRWRDENGMNHSPDRKRNVNIELGKWPVEDMIKLYQDHDVFLGPSWGEGFGFLPFQMLATGGISIVTEEWCHYSDYLGPFGIRSKYTQSPWRGEHEGLMCKPDQKHLEELIRLSYDEFDSYRKTAFKNAVKLHEEYDWCSLTERVFEGLEERALAKIDAM